MPTCPKFCFPVKIPIAIYRDIDEEFLVVKVFDLSRSHGSVLRLDLLSQSCMRLRMACAFRIVEGNGSLDSGTKIHIQGKIAESEGWLLLIDVKGIRVRNPKAAHNALDSEYLRASTSHKPDLIVVYATVLEIINEAAVIDTGVLRYVLGFDEPCMVGTTGFFILKGERILKFLSNFNGFQSVNQTNLL